ncbi:MAG: hypothetical protein DWQ07_06110 [Chloroflexi bacterium]|nr:MAG: hypothetical protein DWQ07_06110 [Chloroflexota bacterium]MBL1195997.1 FtsQ-type POTRA domain-containing protein [Chloroflexota bacterium]NOH13291.1 FtsQ-type POTRA domain-containing protein [Chloroflexota bacterium]
MAVRRNKRKEDRKRDARRSDSVRSRRSERLRKGTGFTRKSLAERALPPMVARQSGGVSMARKRGSSRKEKSSREARRRFDFALSASGAEMRLPALPAFRIGWRIVSFLMVALAGTAVYLLWTTPALNVSQVEIRGLNRLSADDINAILGLSGTSVFAVDPHMVLDLVKTGFPELVEPSVHVTFPAKVVVEVAERQPVVAWEHEGFVVWVDKTGIAFLPRGQAEGLIPVQAVDVPPAEINADNLTQQLLSAEMVTGIVELSARAPDKTQIVYDPRYGLGWSDPRGWQAFFGLEPKDMDQRIAVYEALVKQLKQEGITPSIVSVEYIHAPYYR